MKHFQQIVRWARFFLRLPLDPLASIGFLKELRRFRRMGGSVNRVNIYLADKTEAAGSGQGHYFHQDLLVAQRIYENNPRTHLDVGGRIDGFVAHVASFRKIHVLDIRFFESTNENIIFEQTDIFVGSDWKADSVSCLHTLEHFGLGRYGDPINPNGSVDGFRALKNLLLPGGILYVSVPISDLPRTEFNAHRVFSPDFIPSLAAENSMKIRRFDWVDDDGRIQNDSEWLSRTNAQQLNFGLGIYELELV